SSSILLEKRFPYGLRRQWPRGPMKPGGHCRLRPYGKRFSSKIDEDRLADVRGESGITVHLAQRGGIDQVQIPFNELGKARLAAFDREPAEQGGVNLRHAFTTVLPPRRKPHRENNVVDSPAGCPLPARREGGREERRNNRRWTRMNANGSQKRI